MKVGILTIQKSPTSYGANLQDYAFWNYLNEQNDIDPYVIDLMRPCHKGYKPYHGIVSNTKVLGKKENKIKKNLKETPVFLKKKVIRNKANFDKSWSQIKFTKQYTIRELYKKTPDLDVFIAGSDQIWNPTQSYSIEPFFLTFTDKKKISYSSSIGIENIPETTKKYFKKWLASFSSVAVREEEAKNELQSIGLDNIAVTVDPTFLLTREDWDKYASINDISPKEKYILFYCLKYDDSFYEMYKRFSKESDIKCIVLDGKKNDPEINEIHSLGPKDFINLIKNAEYIVTNSFHCAVFSIMYDKNFSVLLNKGNEKRISRIQTLLNLCKAEDRICEQSKFNVSSLKYEKLDKSLLDKRIEFSKEYLKGALGIEEKTIPESILRLKKIKCTGCRSCEQSCAKHAITMCENQEGFFYPVVNENCTNCGLCVKRCPILSPLEKNNFEQKCYGLTLKDTELLSKSSSGGVFAGIADYFLKNNGVVYGCAYDENFTAKIVRITEISELVKLQGSKYVSSSTEDTYSLVKKDLQSDLKVLYSGLPCQIAGLRKYLGKEYENLYTIDLICHGTPSQKLFKKYLTWQSRRLNEKIKYYGFRDKDVGGWSCDGKIETLTKKRKILNKFDPYYASFLRDEIFRESCYLCSFSNKNRVGDITAGDFWGVKLFYPERYRKEGISVIIVNNKKGKYLFNLVSNVYNYWETSYDKISLRNHNLLVPSTRSPVRESIYSNIDTVPINRYFKNFKHSNYFIFTMKKFTKKVLGKIYRKLFRKK